MLAVHHLGEHHSMVGVRVFTMQLAEGVQVIFVGAHLQVLIVSLWQEAVEVQEMALAAMQDSPLALRELIQV
jgi:hypothetical protein